MVVSSNQKLQSARFSQAMCPAKNLDKAYAEAGLPWRNSTGAGAFRHSRLAQRVNIDESCWAAPVAWLWLMAVKVARGAACARLLGPSAVCIGTDVPLARSRSNLV